MAWLTTAEVKTLLGVTASTWDTQIAALLPAVQAGIEAEIGRAIASASYSEQYSGHGSPILQLRNRPVISITSVWDSLDRVFDDTTLLPTTSYHCFKRQGRIELDGGFTDWPDERRGSCFGDGIANVRVDYVAGYATEPGDLGLVLAKDIWTVINTGKAGGKSSESIGDHSLVYQTAFERRDAQSQAIIDAWKKRGGVL